MKKLESLKSELFAKSGIEQQLNLNTIKGGKTGLDADSTFCDGKDTSIDSGTVCDCTTQTGDCDRTSSGGGSTTFGIARS